MTPRAGHCTKCDQPIWAITHDPLNGRPILLWPWPEGVYLVVETPQGLAPGIGFHAQCAPPIGSPLGAEITVRVTGGTGDTVFTLADMLVVDRMPAPLRYGAWYEARFGQWLAAWLADHVKLPETAIQPLLAKWQRDSAMVREIGAGAWPT